jgi:hypothetical protein
MELGEDGTEGGPLNDLVVVKGDLTLDGTLNVLEATGGNYGPGLYRMLSYTGNLTDNGLAIGNLPRGSAMIQTAMAQQVNLIAGAQILTSGMVMLEQSLMASSRVGTASGRTMRATPTGQSIQAISTQAIATGRSRFWWSCWHGSCR